MKSKKIKAVKKLCILALGIFLSLTFLSCKSLPKKHEPVNLTIFIIDEKDQPVQDYEICLGGRGQTACSNKNGLCIFYDCKLYEYSISGKKSGYTQILQNQACLEKTSELFCYRVLSAAYVLDQAEALFEKGEYQKALELLDRLCPDNNACLQETLCFYKAYAFASLGQKEKAGIQLWKIREFDNPAFEASKYCKAIEQMLEQVPLD